MARIQVGQVMEIWGGVWDGLIGRVVRVGANGSIDLRVNDGDLGPIIRVHPDKQGYLGVRIAGRHSND